VSFEVFVLVWLGVLCFWGMCVISEELNRLSGVTQNIATIYNLILSYISLIFIFVLFDSFIFSFVIECKIINLCSDGS